MNNYNVSFYKYFKKFRLNVQNFLNRIAIPDYTRFTIFAIFIGAIAGFGAVLFHESIDLFSHLFFNKNNRNLLFYDGLFFIALPAIGMLIQSLMIKAAPIDSKRKGVSEVIKAVAMRAGYIRFRTTLFHFIAPAICISTGGTLGPEGPAAQVGGGLASKVGQILGFSDTRRRIYTAAGSGAAIAAVFNTPLGGIFFALEIILLNDFQSATFSALILASVTASVIARIFLGNTPAFHFDVINIGSYDQIYLYAILGIFAGLLSLLFIGYSDYIANIFKQTILKKFPQWLVMTFIGLLVGICGYFYHDIFGIGYIAINKMIMNELTWQIVAILLIMKFILVPLTLYSGGFGGLFAPSLFIGASFGFIFATSINLIWGIQTDTTSYVLVSMGAVLGGINSIPISAILIIFEMTRDYTFILPLMLAVVTSTTIVQLILKGSIHEKQLERQGFFISRGRESSILRSIAVKDIVRKDIILVSENMQLPELAGKYIESKHGSFYTVDQNQNLMGAISERELRPIITEYNTLQKMLVASDIARNEIVVVKDNEDLDNVLKLFGKMNVNEFPVVSSKNPKKIIGTVWHQDVVAAYNRESLKQNLTEGFIRELRTLKVSPVTKISEGYSISEHNAPKSFMGKSLTQLQLRKNYGLEVIMIRSTKSPFLENGDDSEVRMPDPNYLIKKDDLLVFFGSNENIKQIKDWN